MNNLPTVLAYLGPETMLPLTSVVAGVAGVLMMFGRNAWSWAVATFPRITSRGSARSTAVPRPHFRRIGSAQTGREPVRR
jgi:hypothetical protein